MDRSEPYNPKHLFTPQIFFFARLVLPAINVSGYRVQIDPD